MNLPITSTRSLSIITLVGTMTLGMSGYAQAAASAASAAAPARNGTVETVKGATKKAANNTNNAITSAGKKLDARIPRTQAYKKKKGKPAPKVQESR
jgi:uncharacterized protein (DUF2147 family)